MAKVDILDKEFNEYEQADGYPPLNISNDVVQQTIDWIDLLPEVVRITEASRKVYEARIARRIAESEAARISAEAARIVVKAVAARKAAMAEAARKTTDAKKLANIAAEAEEALKVAEAWFARMAAETEDLNPVTDEQAGKAAQATGGIDEGGTADKITEPGASKNSAGATGRSYEARIANIIKDRLVAGQKAIWESEKIKETVKAEIVAWDKDNNVGVEVTGESSPETYVEDMEPKPSFNITSKEFKNIEKYLEMIEHTNNDLQALDIGAEEAIKRLREISFVN